jgi:HEAT repeat protein
VLLAQFLGAEHPAATRCLAADAVSFLAGEARPATQSLVNACLADGDPAVRRRAARALRRLGSDDLDGPALEQLARALQDVCPDVRRNAALALRNVGGGGAVLVEGLSKALRDPYSKVRQNAAQSLGKLGEAAMPATLALAAAAVDENCDVRRRAIEALGLVGAAAGTGTMDGSAATCTAMPSLADAVVTGVLGEAVLRDGDAVVRRVAALALLRLGKGARPAAAQLRAAATELVAAATGENSPGRHCHSTVSLAVIA